MKTCDLHTHSIFSDGTLSPAELVILAEETGLSAIALTDHNTVLGLKEFMKAGEASSVKTVPGCEFTTEYHGKEIHIVGLFLQEAVWDEVEHYFSKLKRSKKESNRLLIRNLQKAGYEITYDEVASSTQASEFNRAHVALLLKEKGEIQSIPDAFATFLKEGNGVFIPPKRLDVFETIEFIKSVGGTAVFAHPFLNLEDEELLAFLPLAKKRGLDAMETMYSDYDDRTAEKAAKLAEKYGLLQSGGSDFHGSVKPAISLGMGRGNLCIPLEFLESLQKKSSPSHDPQALSDRIRNANEVFWLNEKYDGRFHATEPSDFTEEDINEAVARLERFAPVIMHFFPETVPANGIIESPLTKISVMKETLRSEYGADISGKLFLKQDSHLPVSGSVKARGGIYEVLKHTEDLALERGLLESTGDDYRKLTTASAGRLFSEYKIQVGSTGNLGMSIGIMSAALGYQAIVHMSADAKQWKKELLRKRGATVVEYAGDYALAVRKGRSVSDADASSYFVDDENSKELFCGYAVAGQRLKTQLEEQGIPVDEEHPLIVTIPCGVGGAPGGITFGLKQMFGEHVHVFLAEPTQAPCMMIGLMTGEYDQVSVQDFGLTGKTEADGLAVGRCSALVARNIHPLISGEATVCDEHLYPFMKDLWRTEQIFIEPSSCAAFMPLIQFYTTETGRQYIREHDLDGVLPQATNIVWATGGSMMPEKERNFLLENRKL